MEWIDREELIRKLKVYVCVFVCGREYMVFLCVKRNVIKRETKIVMSLKNLKCLVRASC